MTAFRRRWHKGTRFYEAEACEDLFGTPCVRLTWGRIGTACGRIVLRPYESRGDALDALDAVGSRRAARGYTLAG